jgi:nitrite reductase/ring-hydroxylating ferredoxin subunit
LDPVQRLKVIVTRAALPNVSVPRLTAETMVREHLRLYQSFPKEVENALLPFRALIADAIRAAQAVGEFPGIDAEIDAELIHQLIISRFHLRALGGLTLQRGRLLRCPEHGSMFDVTTGECVLPSQDGWTGTLPTYHTRVVEEVVQVSWD